MRKAHLFIHAICLVAITALVLERRSSDTTKALSIDAESVATPKPSPRPSKSGATTAKGRVSAPNSELDPLAEILREYGDESDSDDEDDVWQARHARYERLVSKLSPLPPELAARKTQLDRDWLVLNAELPFRSLNLKSDIFRIGEIETLDSIKHLEIEDIIKKLEASRSLVPAEELPILEKMLTLIQDEMQLAREDTTYDISTYKLDNITDSLSDDEMLSVSDHLVAMVKEGDRLSKLQQRGELKPEQMAAWETLAEKVNRDFATLPPSKPNFEDWMEGEKQVLKSRLSDQLIEYWREEIQRHPQEEEEEP